VSREESRLRRLLAPQGADPGPMAARTLSTVKAPEPVKAPGPPWEEPLTLTDRAIHDAWEASLSKKDLETWTKLRDMLVSCGPEMRMRAVGWGLRGELEHARRMYQVARNVRDEQYKAEFLVRAGRDFAESVARLEDRLSDVFPVVEPLNALLHGLWSDVSRLESMWRQTRHVADPGAWAASYPGLARGEGISGYDTPQGVARVRARLEAGIARARERAANRKPRKRTARNRRKAPKGSVSDGQRVLTRPE